MCCAGCNPSPRRSSWTSSTPTPAAPSPPSPPRPRAGPAWQGSPGLSPPPPPPPLPHRRRRQRRLRRRLPRRRNPPGPLGGLEGGLPVAVGTTRSRLRSRLHVACPPQNRRWRRLSRSRPAAGRQRRRSSTGTDAGRDRRQRHCGVTRGRQRRALTRTMPGPAPASPPPSPPPLPPRFPPPRPAVTRPPVTRLQRTPSAVNGRMAPGAGGAAASRRGRRTRTRCPSGCPPTPTGTPPGRRRATGPGRWTARATRRRRLRVKTPMCRTLGLSLATLWRPT